MTTPRNRSAAASRFRGDPGTVRELPARAVLVLLTAYRTAISPTRPPSCRYSPTCSAYAVQAIQRFGLVRGGWLAVRRLLRCHPFHAGGHDPVPEGVGRTGHPPAAPVSRPAA